MTHNRPIFQLSFSIFLLVWLQIGKSFHECVSHIDLDLGTLKIYIDYTRHPGTTVRRMGPGATYLHKTFKRGF